MGYQMTMITLLQQGGTIPELPALIDVLLLGMVWIIDEVGVYYSIHKVGVSGGFTLELRFHNSNVYTFKGIIKAIYGGGGVAGGGVIQYQHQCL